MTMSKVTATQEIAARALAAQLDAMLEDPNDWTRSAIDAKLEAARAASAARRASKGRE